ncbi:MAG: metallophosphoesterase family protein [Kofleriaceae bacterium]
MGSTTTPTLRLAGIALLAIAGCGLNESGNLGSTKTGDTSNQAARGSPLAILQEACGAEGLLYDAAVATVHRPPYLQQLTTHSVLVGWVSMAPDGQTVEVTAPDGTQVATAAAAVQQVGVRTAGEQQVWAAITGLEPDTIYCYTLSAGGSPLSERIGFRTPPTADSTRPVRFMAFGDSGGGGGDQRALVDQMEEVPFELMIHTGDLAYDSGTISEIESTVFDIYSHLFRHLAFYPAAGNHDYETMQGAPFRDVFALPENGELGVEKWYSYDWGRIHFVALDTESSYATQAEWLDRDLTASQAPWKIIYLHRPPYSSGDHGSDTALRAAIAPVAESHHVQLILAGHDHDYERCFRRTAWPTSSPAVAVAERARLARRASRRSARMSSTTPTSRSSQTGS